MTKANRLVWLGLLLTLACSGFAHMQVLGKEYPNDPLRHHPIEALISGPRTFEPSTGERGVDGNRLLVMLVQFQPDDDERTTGRGLFLTEDDADDYPITLGAPPHDRAFFELHCEALRYYWRAGSMGYFDLDYEVWPRNGYYNLPHEMTWYNPPGADNTLMVERFEAYFADIFALADADPDLTLGDFDHYMVIHAGADWQHDVLANSPGDMPSFFITVGDGKEVTVDDGATVIRTLCNVPEMISQDETSQEAGDLTYVSGYGVINAVMAHEFGHSLGLPDLYNTAYMRPMVGFWDIMDSGGSTLLNLGVDDKIYSIEGPIPALPSAWSKELLWGDKMRADGLLRDITSFDLSKRIGVVAAGAPVDELGPNEAYIIKVPLNDREYALIENRQADHDRDGPTTLVGDASENSRVILYPTGQSNYIADEYDYALPGWPGPDGRYYGGGLAVWRVNDRVIYDEGYWDGDDFVNNLEANRVNVDYNNRGLTMIEADGMYDQGNINSMYWEGVIYDLYFPLMPVINSDATFDNWSVETANNELSAASDPAFVSSDGDPSIFTIYDIDSEHYHRPFHVAPRVLTFRCRMQMFDGSMTLPTVHTGDNARLAWNPEPAFLGGNALGELAVFDGDEMTTFTHIVEGDDETWESPLGEQSVAHSAEYPVAVGDFRSDVPGGEFLLTCGEELAIVRSPNVLASHVFHSPGVGAPMIYDDEDGVTVTAFPTADTLYINYDGDWTALDLPAAKLCSNRRSLYAFSKGRVWYIKPEFSDEKLAWVELPFDETPFEPVALLDVNNTADSGVYLQNAQGDIWRVAYGSEQAEEIFKLSPYSKNQPTQLALSCSKDNGASLTFAVDELIFGLTPLGKLHHGSPYYNEGYPVAPLGSPRVVNMDGQSITYFPGANGGWVTTDPAYSMSWPSASVDDLFFWEEESARLYFANMVVAQGEARPVLSWLDEQYENPIVWGGYRNDGSGGLRASIGQGVVPVTPPLEISAFPNPCSTGEVRIRVDGAFSEIKVRIFDIAGNLVYQKQHIQPDEPIRWNVSGVSSGAYFAVVSARSAMGGEKSETLRLAVIH